MITWEEIAKEYRREIEALWDDIHNAHEELNRGEPKSFKRGVKMIEKSLDFSTENIRILSYAELSQNKVEVVKKKIVQPQQEKRYNEDCFKWLRSH